MSATHEKERTLTNQIGREVGTALPGVEVLAVELSAPDRFTVFVDHAEGVDHALCARVTDVLRPYLAEYAVEVSSPGIERPLRTPEHFRNVLGRTVSLRIASLETGSRKKRLRAEVLSAGDAAVTVRAGEEPVEIPYESIVRGNLIYTESQH